MVWVSFDSIVEGWREAMGKVVVDKLGDWKRVPENKRVPKGKLVVEYKLEDWRLVEPREEVPRLKGQQLIMLQLKEQRLFERLVITFQF